MNVQALRRKYERTLAARYRPVPKGWWTLMDYCRAARVARTTGQHRVEAMLRQKMLRVRTWALGPRRVAKIYKEM